MSVVNPIAEAFAPILGVPSWLVTRGVGAFVTMEFGDPQLSIGQPRIRTVEVAAGSRRKVPTRDVTVHGSWHLWIYCCEWSLSLDGAELAHCESNDATIARGLSILGGQALTEVAVDGADGGSAFHFDLGCLLMTRPAPAGSYSDEPVDQWMLFEATGTVLTVRSDGRYMREPSTEQAREGPWLPLPQTA
jgi:hypothetical protein